MNIEKAKQLKRGASVWVPADRGSAPAAGLVIAPALDGHGGVTLRGDAYVWITVRTKLGEAVWPSNRLG